MAVPHHLVAEILRRIALDMYSVEPPPLQLCLPAGDEIHLYEVPATNLLLVRAKRSTDSIINLLGYLLYFMISQW